MQHKNPSAVNTMCGKDLCLSVGVKSRREKTEHKPSLSDNVASMFLSTLPDTCCRSTRRHSPFYFSACLPLYHFCKAIFLPCSRKVQIFLSQLSFLHICSFSTNNNINDVLSTVTWPRLWVLKIARDTTDYNPQSGSRGSQRCRCEDRSYLWVSELAPKHSAILSWVFYFFIYIWICIKWNRN